MCARAGLSDGIIATEALSIDSVGRVLAKLGAIARAGTIFIAARTDVRQNIRSVSRITRDDIDDAVHCVCTPKRSARSADDFDTLDVFEQDILHVPEHTRVQRRIDAAPVNEYEKLVCSGAIEA